MSNIQDDFKSSLLQAMYKLQHVQSALLSASERSPPEDEKTKQTWSLLWANWRACFLLTTTIYATANEVSQDTVGESGKAELPALPTLPVVSPIHPEFTHLKEQVERSMKSVAQMRHHTARAYETLISLDQGDSHCGHAVNLCRLYGDTVDGLLGMIAKGLEAIPGPTLVN